MIFHNISHSVVWLPVVLSKWLDKLWYNAFAILFLQLSCSWNICGTHICAAAQIEVVISLLDGYPSVPTFWANYNEWELCVFMPWCQLWLCFKIVCLCAFMTEISQKYLKGIFFKFGSNGLSQTDRGSAFGGQRAMSLFIKACYNTCSAILQHHTSGTEGDALPILKMYVKRPCSRICSFLVFYQLYWVSMLTNTRNLNLHTKRRTGVVNPKFLGSTDIKFQMTVVAPLGEALYQSCVLL